MKLIKPVFDNTFSKGKSGRGGGLTQCWYNIRRGGYLVMVLDYKGGTGGGGAGPRIWEKVIK